jgi:hypothetical protein
MKLPFESECSAKDSMQLRGSPFVAAWELSLGFMLGEKALF